MGRAADGIGVGVVKAILAAVLLAGLLAIGSRGQPVLAAYTSDDDRSTNIALGGIDLAVGLTPVGPSPYLVDPAPDTGEHATGIAVQPRRLASAAAPTVKGGTARLSGTVIGPEGPVPQASVRIERETREGLATVDLVTDELGFYDLPGAHGGRYRIRAWVIGRFTMTLSYTLFLNDGETENTDLIIGPVDPGPYLGFTHRGDIHVGLTGTVAVSVNTRSIGDNGLVNVSGVAGAAVSLTPSPGVTSIPAEAVTDGSGVARFVLQCHRQGPASGVIRYNQWQATAVLPNCRPIPDAAPGVEQGGSESTPATDPVHQELVAEVVAETGDQPVVAAEPVSE